MIDDTRAVFRHLKEIRMDVETGRKFIELSAISEALASRFGQKYIHCAPIANELTALIMCDDIIIRTALQDLMREILKS